MRTFCLSIFLVLFFTGQAYAFTDMNDANIIAAQKYGKSKANAPLADFLSPWTSYEQKAMKLDATSPRAQMFTPYLLVAADARGKAVKGSPITLEDGEQLLEKYKGYLVFRVFLANDWLDHPDKARIVIRQGNRTIKATSVATDEDKTLYVYFPIRDINSDKQLVLKILNTDCQFLFNTGCLR